MKWQQKAEEAVGRAPFFVRKIIRKRVEEEAARSGASEVRLEHVKSCQRKFLSNMEDEVQGFQIEQCFGQDGCLNQAVKNQTLAGEIERILAGGNLKKFLKSKVTEPLKLHHQFRVAIADCPNACSRPQIVDIGLIGARQPSLDPELCTNCGACAEVCKEQAITTGDTGDFPALHDQKCVNCGQCIEVCSSGAIRERRRGYRILIGGKLGRHPQLGAELQGIRSMQEVLVIVERCLDHYLELNVCGERFGEILNRHPLEIHVQT